MCFRNSSGLSVWPLAIFLVAGGAPALGFGQGSPTASNILARVIARAAQVAQGDQTERYAYVKRTRFEELDASGAAVNSTEKTYNVVLIGGWPFSRLVKVQGVELSPAESRREEQREQHFRNKLAGRDLDKAAREKEPLVLPELIDRYDFSVLSNEVCQARNVIVLSFKPKPTNSDKSLQDKIFSRLAGCIWVDEQEAEIAKLHVSLTQEFSLGWIGMLGSVKQCDLSLDRQRMPDGTWVDAGHTLLLVGRRLLSPMRFRTTELCSDFHHPAEPGHPLLLK